MKNEAQDLAQGGSGEDSFKRLVMLELIPMKDAPRDGTEILAYDKGGKNFHPIIWKDWPWLESNIPHWGMRWNEAYCTQDGFYLGWIPYPKYKA